MKTIFLEIPNILTIKIEVPENVIERIESYFPNLIMDATCADFDFSIKYIHTSYIKNTGNHVKSTIVPFRNSTYQILRNDKEKVLFAPPQTYTKEHFIIRLDKSITLYVREDREEQNLIHLITELIVRKLLELNFFPIHASCVVRDSFAKLFFGSKGSGKSVALFSSVTNANTTPLANDITFVGKINGIWYAFGTPYELTFDKSLKREMEKHSKADEEIAITEAYSSSKIRYTPQEFCKAFGTSWIWLAPISDLNYVKLSPNHPYQEELLSNKEALSLLKNYGKDKNFNFGDLLFINGLSPSFDYQTLTNEIPSFKIEGNIIRYHQSKKERVLIKCLKESK